MDIVALGFRPWTVVDTRGIYVRDMHLIANIAKQPSVGKILHISRPVSLAERLLRRTPVRLRSGQQALEGPGYRLYHLPELGEFYSLITRLPSLLAPIGRKRLWWNDAILSRTFRRAAEDAYNFLGLDQPILLNWTPFAPSAPDVLPHSLYAFDMIDNFSNHARIVDQSEIRACRDAYTRIGREADIITSVSAKALKVFEGRQRDIHVIPNGVDRSWLSMSPPAPADLLPFRASGPVIGTGGYLFEKFRIDLLVELAGLMPNATFVLVGKLLTQEIRQRVAETANIVFLGFKPISEIPAYYQNFDVGFIFYEMSKENDGDPLKLYEFIALGTPVISLPSMGIRQKDGVVEIIATAAEAKDRIEAFLAAEGDARAATVREALSETDTWQGKAAKLTDLFAAGLGQNTNLEAGRNRWAR